MANQSDNDPTAPDTWAGDTLPPSEATDSDQLHNDDGDTVVTAPDRWLAADDEALSGDAESESLDDKLQAEEPDIEAIREPGGDSFFTAEE